MGFVKFKDACLPDLIRRVMKAHPDIIDFYDAYENDKYNSPHWYFRNGLNCLIEPGEKVDDAEVIYRLLKLMAWLSMDAQTLNTWECGDCFPEWPFTLAKDVKYDDEDKRYRFDHIKIKEG